METSVVKFYRQDGGYPNPSADTLLGTDTTFPGGVWGINTSGWSEGRYTVYAVGYDLAGNQSNLTSRDIGVLPNPLKVSSTVTWYLGELNNTQIGSFSS